MSEYVSPDEPTDAAWRCPTYRLQGLSRVNATDTNKVTFHLRSGTTLTGWVEDVRMPPKDWQITPSSVLLDGHRVIPWTQIDWFEAIV